MQSCATTSVPEPGAASPKQLAAAATTIIQMPLRSGLPHIAGYRIDRHLGAGAMGTAYLAVRMCDGELVAIKILHEHLRHQPHQVERFLREAAIARGIRHRNVLQVLDAGVAGDVPFIVTRYMPRGDLASLIDQHGPLSPARLQRLAEDLAAGLQALAARHVLHRDLKPANILLAEDGTALIADFGIACSPEDAPGLTHDGSVLGTPAYMSPEQAAALPLDDRTDIYGVGAILFTAATGRPPFVGSSAYAIVAQILRDPPPQLATLRPDLPKQLVGIIDRCLAHDRRQRFLHAGELAEALSRGRAPEQNRTRAPSRPSMLRTLILLVLEAFRIRVGRTETAHSLRPLAPPHAHVIKPGWRVFYPRSWRCWRRAAQATAPKQRVHDRRRWSSIPAPRPVPVSTPHGTTAMQRRAAIINAAARGAPGRHHERRDPTTSTRMPRAPP